MRPVAILPIIAFIAAALPAYAADGPEPPHAPTPDEAAAAYNSSKPNAPAAAQPSAGASSTAPSPASTAATASPPAQGDSAKTGDATKTGAQRDASSSGNDAIRKAQENGSYKMKDGGMYQPPQTRPAPLWNKEYGRT